MKRQLEVTGKNINHMKWINKEEFDNLTKLKKSFKLDNLAFPMCQWCPLQMLLFFAFAAVYLFKWNSLFITFLKELFIVEIVFHNNQYTDLCIFWFMARFDSWVTYCTRIYSLSFNQNTNVMLTRRNRFLFFCIWMTLEIFQLFEKFFNFPLFCYPTLEKQNFHNTGRFHWSFIKHNSLWKWQNLSH